MTNYVLFGICVSVVIVGTIFMIDKYNLHYLQVLQPHTQLQEMGASTSTSTNSSVVTTELLLKIKQLEKENESLKEYNEQLHQKLSDFNTKLNV